jgi:hypothetical protein
LHCGDECGDGCGLEPGGKREGQKHPCLLRVEIARTDGGAAALRDVTQASRIGGTANPTAARPVAGDDDDALLDRASQGAALRWGSATASNPRHNKAACSGRDKRIDESAVGADVAVHDVDARERLDAIEID